MTRLLACIGEEVIEPIEHSDWASPIVSVIKLNSSICINVYMYMYVAISKSLWTKWPQKIHVSTCTCTPLSWPEDFYTAATGSAPHDQQPADTWCKALIESDKILVVHLAECEWPNCPLIASHNHPYIQNVSTKCSCKPDLLRYHKSGLWLGKWVGQQ